MSNEDIIAKINEALAAHGGMDKSVKFDFGDEGKIHIKGKEAVPNDDDADCTITVTKDDFVALSKGELDPMGAFMSGKLKVAGDMSVAMSLQSLFASM